VVGIRYAKNWAEQRGGVVGALGLGGGDASEKAAAPGSPAPAPTTQAPPAPVPTGTTPAPTAAPPAPVAIAAADGSAHPTPTPEATPPANPVAQAGGPDARSEIAENHPAQEKNAEKTEKTEDDDEPDEEALLRDAVPNAENEVIGEEEAEATPAPKAGAKKPAPAAKTKAPAAKTAAPPAPAKVETAVLRITSAPAGAIVRTKARVLGRTPINLHFKTGNTYELKLVKSGYTPATRRVAVNNAKTRQVAVSLKKKPKPAAKKRSFFHPHR